MSIERLVTAAEKTAQVADTLGESFARLLARVLRETERRLVPLVTDASDGSRTAIVKAAQANRTRVEIRAALQASGYDDLATSVTGATLDPLVDAVLSARRIAQQASALNRWAEIRIAALKALQAQDLLDEGDALAKALWQATVRGVFASRPVPQILADLGSVLDDTEPHLRTLFDTSISMFGRQVEALHADEDPTAVFAYMGPLDDKTRDFCAERVGKVYTRAEIDQMDNGQIDNVFLTGGGYNCRHVWMEVSKLSELQDYVGTDKRIPEVQRQLRDAA